MRKVGKDIDEYDQKLGALQEQLHRLLLELPNLPMDDVPLGKGEEENIVVREWGTPIDFDFTPLTPLGIGREIEDNRFPTWCKISRLEILRSGWVWSAIRACNHQFYARPAC